MSEGQVTIWMAGNVQRVWIGKVCRIPVSGGMADVDDVSTLNLCSPDAASAIEKLLLAQDRHRLQLILELNNPPISKRDLRKLFHPLSTQLMRVTACGRAALLLPDAASGKLRTEMV